LYVINVQYFSVRTILLIFIVRTKKFLAKNSYSTEISIFTDSLLGKAIDNDCLSRNNQRKIGKIEETTKLNIWVFAKF